MKTLRKEDATPRDPVAAGGGGGGGGAADSAYGVLPTPPPISGRWRESCLRLSGKGTPI